MKVPDDLKYTEKHEWAKAEGDKARVGITDFAQHELTDIVYVELPAVGKEYKKGDVLAVVESVKSTSDMFAPVSGTVVEVNKSLDEKPEVINKDPYGAGWLAILKVSAPAEMQQLMTPDQYRKHISK